jgi:hypothetical protein
MNRIDINAIIDKIDMDRLVEKIDVQEIVRRSNLDAIIKQSTTGVLTAILDLVRAQLIRCDQVLHSITQCCDCCNLRCLCWRYCCCACQQQQYHPRPQRYQMKAHGRQPRSQQRHLRMQVPSKPGETDLYWNTTCTANSSSSSHHHHQQL